MELSFITLRKRTEMTGTVEATRKLFHKKATWMVDVVGIVSPPPPLNTPCFTHLPLKIILKRRYEHTDANYSQFINLFQI